MSAELIVECLRRYRTHRAAKTTGAFRVIAVHELASATVAGNVDHLLKDPVRSALMGEVRDVGWRYSRNTGRRA
ncbi:hypothetical protein GCM10007301_28150 [Azorhizobium oxalatiphilum]|uniref:Uncharacterized protein n=1 Tax=Azorhizobium oxalatiphilum TaxID=980631 RepID=A0A917C0S9_9HYPH|nr:hypothetical protein GCM10007301_28150 [Azorhizobium oxalatiphilum]